MKQLLVIVLIALTSCHQANNETDLRYVILKHGQPREKYYGFGENGKETTLSNVELLKIEDLLSKKISDHNKNARYKASIIDTPQKYYKQFIAVINPKGEKEVLVTCFCNTDWHPTWKKQLIIMNDGGSCYFDFKINLTNNTITDFSVNNVGKTKHLP